MDSGRGRRRGPNGAAVRPGQGNALVDVGTHRLLSAQRANRSPGRTVGPLGRYDGRVASVYQGVALAWANGWAFGPQDHGWAFGPQKQCREILLRPTPTRSSPAACC